MRAKMTRTIKLLEVNGNKAVLTHGFIKKTNKTPPSEIERAIQYRDEYMKQFNTKADK